MGEGRVSTPVRVISTLLYNVKNGVFQFSAQFFGNYDDNVDATLRLRRRRDCDKNLKNGELRFPIQKVDDDDVNEDTV